MLLHARTLQAIYGFIVLRIRRRLATPTWWPFQEKTCSGCTICAGFGFEISPMRSGFPLL